MRAHLKVCGRLLLQGSSVIAITAALAGGAAAQTVTSGQEATPAPPPTPPPAQSVDQAQAANIPGPSTAGAQPQGAQGGNVTVSGVVVTGSRIQRAGFNAPTPTTVLGSVDLRQGDRDNIAQVLDDLPEFRASSTPATTGGSYPVAAYTLDLRGLGPIRTLTLLDGHRFTGSSDLNTVPQSIISRVDVVTGGASAAWGSGAVSGVVNIILDDKLTGLTLGADGGTSDRGDGNRYGFNATYGTNFLDGRGHFMIAGEYLKDKGIFDRDIRPPLNSAVVTDATGQLILENNVKYTIINTGGAIIGGKANGLVFTPDGSLGPSVQGSQNFAGGLTLGGTGQSIYDYVAVSSPYQRGNVFTRASYDLNDKTKVWADFSYSDVHSNYPFFPATPIISIKADNPFLTPAARAQLAALGATFPLTVGRILADVGPARYLGFDSDRRNLEGSLGISGSLGGSWTYNAYYDHGELRSDISLYNQAITAKFNKAVDATTGPNGQPICRVNATVNPNNDPACVPIDLLGAGNISAAAVAYAFGAAHQVTTSKLDTTGLSLHGEPFSTWAGPVDVALGGDFRWESLVTNYVDPTSLAGGFGSLNFAPTNGGFNVQEGFGEINVPFLDFRDVLHVDGNGAARYSNYSTSGGIWTWKYGATARVLQDLLLRGTYSRDIRSPSVSEYFSTRGTNIGNAQDPYRGGITQANVYSYTGGNPALTPEISHTMTLGATYSPHYLHGLNFSVDYYSIDIRRAIAALGLQDTLQSCYTRDPNDPTCGGLITRAPDGSISYVTRTYQNLADYRTHGVDFEASYLMPLARLRPDIEGTVRFRLLATHVIELLYNTGVSVTNSAGVVGDSGVGTSFSTPKWRATGSATYENRNLSVDLRVRYVDGGIFNRSVGGNGKPMLNNIVGSRTYTDLGAQYKIGRFTLFAQVDNLFDVQPPDVTYVTAIYDTVGRYYSGGVKVRF